MALLQYDITSGNQITHTSSGRGSGLGLVLAKEIVSMHGGSVIVESEEGVGSSFGFRIPFEVVNTKDESSADSRSTICPVTVRHYDAL